MAPSHDSFSGRGAAFQPTHWSVVIAASQPDSTEAREALARLCETYWYPVYTFVRRRGYDAHQAKDYTQELFARLIEKGTLAVADPQKGRFRSFLLTCLQHLLSHERKKEQAVKRGAHYSFVALDEIVAERRYSEEPADELSPEKIFERRWALTILDQTMSQLQREYIDSGRADQFEALQVYLSGAREAPESYAEVGARINLSENAARQAAYRMRCRFGELLRAHVAQTVATPEELAAELAYLRRVLSS